jgi:hypothetical protein
MPGVSRRQLAERFGAARSGRAVGSFGGLEILYRYDRFAFEVTTLPTDSVGHDLAAAVTAMDQWWTLQGVVAAAKALHALGRSSLRYGHDSTPSKVTLAGIPQFRP